jgi:TrmH family RNA methyltransferase
MTPITSLRNPHVQQAARLRDRRQRDRQQRIVIDGARELLRAIEAGVALVEGFVCPPLCRTQDAQRACQALRGTKARVFEVTKAVFEKLAFGERAEGVVAVAQAPAASLERIVLSGCPLVAVLEGVEKPGNLGAVLRSADGAGVSALLVADPRTDLFNPNTIRASLGTVFALPAAAAPADEILAWLRAKRLAIYAARVDGAVPYTQAEFRGPAAIVLGAEAEGLSARWRGEDIQAVRLPMLGVADSLNVSAAAAVLFYEALRQRTG